MAEVSTFLQSNSTLIIGVVIVGSLAIFLFGAALFLRAFLRKVDQGFAMIVNKFGAEPTVRFTNAIVTARAELSSVTEGKNAEKL